MADSASHFLSVRDVSKQYAGVRALDSVAFQLQRGEIHCLAGENGSGKSTLIKILSGVTDPEPGARLEIDGRHHSRLTRRQCIDAGIEVIYQDLALFPNLSVAENIAFCTMLEARSRFMNWPRARAIANDALTALRIKLPLDKAVGELSAADQQLVAIARACTAQLRLLIMDEPTTALTRNEINALFAVVHKLQRRGVTILFVSHKMDEVFEIAQRVTVLRDGRRVGCFPTRDLTPDSLTEQMTGRAVRRQPPRSSPQPADPVLQVSGLGRDGLFDKISLEIHAGEIVGLTGLRGAGRTELALHLFGLQRADRGEIRMNGKPLSLGSARAAIESGMALVPENRATQGLVLEHTIQENLNLTRVTRLRTRCGLLDLPALQHDAGQAAEALGIRFGQLTDAAAALSGGNQQKLVLAKWLATRPRLLILDSPTNGIDVGARFSIHALIRQWAATGMAVLLISDEFEEIIDNTQRILVMKAGRITDRLDSETTSVEQLESLIVASGPGDRHSEGGTGT